jgi:ABC-type multidrug transport system fused ATPase/permease subunit
MGTWELTQGRMSLGALLAFLAFLTQLYSPIRGLARLSNRIFAASASAERIAELLDARPAVRERPHARPLTEPAGRVELDAVTFGYPGARGDALREVSLGVEPGRTLAIVGPSGAGKSTVAKLLLRFYDPQAGIVRLDGHDLRDLRLRDVRASVALLLQETLIFDGTIHENVAFGRPEAGEADVRRAAAAAGLDDVLAGLPDGLETVVGQRGRRLSGGQRQRIAIARAMVRDAPVLVLDEPTTGLDAESSRRVLAPLRRLMTGRATVLVSHDLAAVRDADEIVVLEGGAVAERGSHASLLAAGGVYARLHAGAGPHLEAVS